MSLKILDGHSFLPYLGLYKPNYRKMKYTASAFRLALLWLLMAFFSACSPKYTPFTQRLYDEYRWTEQELKRIQFYTSDDIVLRRELGNSNVEISAGSIRIRDGRRVEEIVIRQGTPGVFLFSPKENRLAISFEDGKNNRFLMFGPNPRQGDRYSLLGAEWDRQGGTVTYDGQTYEVDASGAFAHLLVNLKRARRVEVNSRVASGRKVK